MKAILAALLLLGSPLTTALDTSSAESAPTPYLVPYEADYDTTAMGLGMVLHRSLETTEAGWLLRNQGSVLIASLKEEARFDVKDNRILGQHFAYRLKGLVSRRREVQFDPERGLIRSLRKKQWSEHSWHPDILDRLSQQEQLRIDLLHATTPPKTLTFQVVDGDRVKTRELALVGTEDISVPAGRFTTVHYQQVRENANERASDIWLAPALDYLMVRTLHVEDGSDVRVELRSTTLEPRVGLETAESQGTH